MKPMLTGTAVLSLVCITGAPIAYAAAAFPVDRYRTIAAESIAHIDVGDADLDALRADQRVLIAIGVEGARAYAAEHPEAAEILTFVANNAADMIEMGLEEIEIAWHEGRKFKKIGADIGALDRNGPVSSRIDTIIRPATAIAALEAYRETGNMAYIYQVRDELSEAVKQLSNIE